MIHREVLNAFREWRQRKLSLCDASGLHARVTMPTTSSWIFPFLDTSAGLFNGNDLGFQAYISPGVRDIVKLSCTNSVPCCVPLSPMRVAHVQNRLETSCTPRVPHQKAYTREKTGISRPINCLPYRDQLIEWPMNERGFVATVFKERTRRLSHNRLEIEKKRKAEAEGILMWVNLSFY